MLFSSAPIICPRFLGMMCAHCKRFVDHVFCNAALSIVTRQDSSIVLLFGQVFLQVLFQTKLGDKKYITFFKVQIHHCSIINSLILMYETFANNVMLQCLINGHGWLLQVEFQSFYGWTLRSSNILRFGLKTYGVDSTL